MAIKVHWYDDDQSILVYTLYFPWTVQDLCQVIREGYDISHNNSHDLFLIFDFTYGRQIPKDFLSTINIMDEHYQDNVTKRIIVKPNVMLFLAYGLIKRVAPHLTKGIYFVETMEEALQEIYELQQQS